MRYPIPGVDGKTYLYNPETGRFFSATGDPIQGQLVDGRFQPATITITAPGYVPPPDPSLPPRGTWDPYGNYTPPPIVSSELTTEQQGLLATLSKLLSDSFDTAQTNELINTVIKPALSKGLNEFEIMNLLRATDTWKNMYPEYQQRIDNGFAPMTEAQIREYRDQAKALAAQQGFTLTNDDVSRYIASNKSLSELQSNLIDYEKFKTYGQDVMDALSLELGRPATEAEAFKVLSNDYSDPELDRLYRNAVYKGYATTMHFRAPNEQEIALLNERNVSTEDAVKGYQQLASEMPSYDRLLAIDSNLAGNAEAPHDSVHDLLADIFAADPEAHLRISQTVAREAARWKGTGGIAGGGRGFLTPSER